MRILFRNNDNPYGMGWGEGFEGKYLFNYLFGCGETMLVAVV